MTPSTESTRQGDALEEAQATGRADNLRSAGRTILQFALALLLTGVLTQVWNNAVSTYQIDGFIASTVSVLMGAAVVFYQGQIEDKTGKGILLRKDRLAGDAVLGDGVGTEKGTIVGDTTPTSPTRYVEYRPDRV